MFRSIVNVLVVVGVLAATGPRLPAQQPGQKLPQAAQQAKTAAEEHIKNLGYQGPLRVNWIDDAAVKKAFGETQFIAVLFPQYPVGRQPPKSLKVANVFAFEGAQLRTLTDAKDLETYFKAKLPAAKSEGDTQNAAKAFLRLSQDVYTDGFYQFESATATAKMVEQASVVTGRIAVKPVGGNKGHIDATLKFDADGKLQTAQSTAKLVEGVRPICQALRLLDPDPVIRKMAERDILVMGRMVRDYLLEQRARVGPELQRAIDRVWQQILDEDR
ncbi:MAG TPA: hypothetical protein VEL76_36765 [Gemmataceae bacterium]|nr:hypothetical protein [Gemmataceae bacterium]